LTNEGLSIDLPRRLAPPDINPAAQILSAAFIDDPSWAYLFPDTARRQKTLRRFFRVLARYGVLTGQAYGVGDPLQGVAVWDIPGQHIPARAYLRAGTGFLGLLFSPFFVQIVRGWRIFGSFGELQGKYKPESAYYLDTIGIAPEAQGKGLASALIRPFLARADAEGLPAYTETVTPENVSLYEHYGFQCMERYDVPEVDLSIWSFLRQPSAGVQRG
jgi:ribosomal protein S18 acetylase RimI-like enzyme